MNIAGVEIGGTKIQIVVGTSKGKILARRSFAVVREKGAAGIRPQILQGLAELNKLHPFSKIGVGFGGPIDWRTGRVFKSHHILGWNKFPLANWLQKKFRVKVITDNDANVAALAESRLGAGRGKNPVFYMTVGSGIGGGIIRDGEIYHGQGPSEVEIGHTRIPVPGLVPNKWPILEDRCSGWSLDRRVRAVAKKYPGSILARLVEEGKETRFLGKARRRGDSHAIKIWNQLALDLALALSHVIHLFHPQILIIGGGVSLLGEDLVRDIRKNLKMIVMDAYKGTYEVKLSKLGEWVVPAGAILLVSRDERVLPRRTQRSAK